MAEWGGTAERVDTSALGQCVGESPLRFVSHQRRKVSFVLPWLDGGVLRSIPEPRGFYPVIRKPFFVARHRTAQASDAAWEFREPLPVHW